MAIPATAGQIDFSGVFPEDDTIQLFNASVQTTGLVTITTTSVATGGFIPILALFDDTGQFLYDVDGSGGTSDISLAYTLVAGINYTVSLTQWGNYAIGSQDDGNLSEGFAEAGQGNYTGELPFNNNIGGAFWSGTGGTELTGNWALNFSADDSLGLTASEQGVPEPATFGLALAGAALLLGLRRARKSAH